MDLATCRVCGSVKPAAEFYPRQLRTCGTIGECMECTKQRVRRHRAANDNVRAYDRERAKTPERIAHRAKVSREWRQQNPQAYKAQTAVGNALRDGRLQRGECLFCGGRGDHAHHRDYARPLDVIWLCARCHHRLHANFPIAEGLNKTA